MSRPRVLIGYSRCQLTREAFERAGCEAWTCDLLPPDGLTDFHILGDVWDTARAGWDAAVFHPMCTNLTISGAWAFSDPDFERYPETGYHQRVQPGTLTGAERREARERDLENFRQLLALPYPKAIENPAHSFVNAAIRIYDQAVQPFQFGDNASKRTGFWLDRLPRLRPTSFAEPRQVGATRDLLGHATPRWGNQSDGGQNKLRPSETRWLERSRTFPGLAAAMGDQWGSYLAARAR